MPTQCCQKALGGQSEVPCPRRTVSLAGVHGSSAFLEISKYQTRRESLSTPHRQFTYQHHLTTQKWHCAVDQHERVHSPRRRISFMSPIRMASPWPAPALRTTIKLQCVSRTTSRRAHDGDSTANSMYFLQRVSCLRVAARKK